MPRIIAAFTSLSVFFAATSALPAFAIKPADAPANALATAPAEDAAIISRSVLFGNPDRGQVRVSPDAKHIAFLAPHNGVMNIFVAPVDAPANAKPITNETARGIRQFQWSFTNQHVLYLQDIGGDENWKIFAADISSAAPAVRDLTPFEQILGPDNKPILQANGKPLRPTARIAATSERFPTRIVVGLNKRNPQFHDLYLLDVLSGELTLLYQNDRFGSFILDADYGVRLGLQPAPDGGQEIFQNTGSPTPAAPGKPVGAQWEPFQTIPQADALTTRVVGYNADASLLYMVDSRGRNTGALFELNLATKKMELVGESAKADLSDVLMHPISRTPQAVSFDPLRETWAVVDHALQADFDALKAVAEGDLTISSRSLDDTIWTVTFIQDDGPARSYLYSRATKSATFLFTNRSQLEGKSLSRMMPVLIKSRDGLELPSYLSVPPRMQDVVSTLIASPQVDLSGVKVDFKDATVTTRITGTETTAVTTKGFTLPVPLVLVVHGGPWARDRWGFNPIHQWLANRGYAVLSVNFRGSTGFGKEFVNLGDKNWGTTMHNDLIDAVDWAVKRGIADPKRVAIMGGSYGGYAALAGLTFTPDTFACGISIVGPSNLITLLKSIPPYWAPMVNMFASRVGDHRTEEGRELLKSRSPLTFVDRIRRPLLIGQGANDPRVIQAESDQIVNAMKAKNIPVTYVLFPDEGHGFNRPQNNMAFNAVAEAFLAEHLGGRVEPIGDDFKSSSITVPEGAEFVKGLKPALGK